jgi:hypothetical protein
MFFINILINVKLNLAMKQNILLIISICLLLPLESVESKELVKLVDLEPPSEVRPANIQENHYASKCDSERTKRRAHLFGFMSNQKKLDVESQTQCMLVCIILAETSPDQTNSCIRECNDKEREQRNDVGNSLLQGASILGAAVSLLKAL